MIEVNAFFDLSQTCGSSSTNIFKLNTSSRSTNYFSSSVSSQFKQSIRNKKNYQILQLKCKTKVLEHDKAFGTKNRDSFNYWTGTSAIWYCQSPIKTNADQNVYSNLIRVWELLFSLRLKCVANLLFLTSFSFQFYGISIESLCYLGHW